MLCSNEDNTRESAGHVQDNARCGTAAQLIDLLVGAEDEPDTAVIFAELRHLFPHEFFAFAQLSAYDGRILRLVNISFPENVLESFGFVSDNRECLLVKEWFAQRMPVCIDARGAVLTETGWRSTARTSDGPVALLFHAQLDPTGTRGMGFCFGGVPGNELARCGAVLRFVTPYLYARLARNFWAPLPASAARLLTPREIQVIEWMYYGKTNEEIATLLGNSVYTVKNHVQRILLKLSATNRTQAVLRAVDAGLVKYSDSNGKKSD